LAKLRTLELVDGTRASDALMNAIDSSRTITQPLRPSLVKELLS
jgi:signal transduction histidine kinase